MLVGPALGDQPDAEVEVLGEAVAPRAVPAQGVERGQPHELAVAAHADAADEAARALEHVAVDDELHVLHAGEQPLATVVHTDADLNRARTRVVEVGVHRLHDMRVEAAVGVHHAQDDVIGVAPAEQSRFPEVAHSVVERGAFAPACVRQRAPVQPDPVGVGGQRDRGGAVVGAVVDDQRHEIPGGQRGDTRQAFGKHTLFVQTGDQEYIEPFSPLGAGAANSAAGEKEKTRVVAAGQHDQADGRPQQHLNDHGHPRR